MSGKKKAWIILACVLLVAVLAAAAVLLVHTLNRDEPPAGPSTAGYTFRVTDRGALIATHDGTDQAIFQSDRTGGMLSAAVAPNKVYVLYDDVLYSMDVDGSNRYKVAAKCYHPFEQAGTITDETTTDLRTLWYYGGSVYFVQYGQPSYFCRFQEGGHQVDRLNQNTVSAFTISPEGVLTGYSGPDNENRWEEVLTMDLNG